MLHLAGNHECQLLTQVSGQRGPIRYIYGVRPRSWQLKKIRCIFTIAWKPRIHLPGGLYHVILRSNGGQPVFLVDEDRYRFYLLLQEGTHRFGHRIQAFCLMTNLGKEIWPRMTP